MDIVIAGGHGKVARRLTALLVAQIGGMVGIADEAAHAVAPPDEQR